jgi:predicted RNA binding protein YcfA (HicA-like mRNA interferase family)
MPKLYSSNYIVKILLSMGFEFISQRGSHAKFRKINGQTLTVIVPMARKETPIGTFKSILKQSNLSESDFE